MVPWGDLPALLAPLPIYGVLLMALIAWRTGHRRWWLVLAWLYVMSTPVTANIAAAWLENRYRPIESLAPYRGQNVVLLTSGNNRLDPSAGWVNRPAESGWERLLVAVETARRVRGSLFIAGGRPAGENSEPIARTMKDALERLGVPLERVVLETNSANTYENLAFLADEIGDEPFILVTSAAHMPRAMAIAGRLGLNATPQPGDFLQSGIVGLRSFLPTVAAIAHWQILLHEIFGFMALPPSAR